MDDTAAPATEPASGQLDIPVFGMSRAIRLLTAAAGGVLLLVAAPRPHHPAAVTPVRVAASGYAAALVILRGRRETRRVSPTRQGPRQ